MCAARNEPGNPEQDWFKNAFNELYPVLYSHRTVEAAQPEARFAIETLAVTGQDALLDLCCGEGRHLVHLVQSTAHAIGLDYSPDLLRIARGRLANTPLVRADMRAIPFVDCFDVVVNFFTSFGYFEEREDNLSVVCGVAQALKREGRFLIDYMNPAFVYEHFVPGSQRSAGPYDIQERRWITETPWRVHKRTTVYESGRAVEETCESVQLYTPDEFVALLRQGGLTVNRLYGDFTGADVDDTRPRIIAVGHRT